MESRKKPLKIIPAPEAIQETAVKKYNEDKKKTYDKIPLVLRNQETGWPLLQLTYLAKLSDGRYEPVLGGGKCHYFPLSHFCLAMLLSQVDGGRSATDYLHEKVTMKEFNLLNIGKLLDGFEFNHAHYHITIATEPSAYGKTTTVTATDEAISEILLKALDDAFKKAVKPRRGISQIAGWDDMKNPDLDKYTAAQLREAVNPECAIFYNGNIYLDLGALVQDKACRDYLEQIFKPLEFLKLPIPKQKPQPIEEDKYVAGVKATETDEKDSPEIAKIKAQITAETTAKAMEKLSLLLMGDNLKDLIIAKNPTGTSKPPKETGLTVAHINLINTRVQELEESSAQDFKALFSDSARQTAVAALNHIIELDNQKKYDELRIFIQAMKDRQPYKDKTSGKVYEVKWREASRTTDVITQLWDELYKPQQTAEKKEVKDKKPGK